MVGISHPSEEQLELYALGRLTESRLAEVEDHLLVCAVCQERLDDWESFALAMRDGIAEEGAVKPARSWFRLPRLRLVSAVAWAGGFAAILLAVVLYLHPQPGVVPLASLQLTAMRGQIGSVTPARETDIVLADAPSGPGLRVELVDGGGGMIWSGPLEEDRHGIGIRKQLPAGNYFVRLYDHGGNLLHEYGFRCAPASNR